MDFWLPGERELVLGHGTGEDVALPALSLPEQIERRAARQPHAHAVEAPEGTLTYAELGTAANRLAHLLLGRGIGPGHRVAVLLPRGTRLITAFTAILKAGAAYLPVDPAFPAERIAFLVDDGAPAVVLATRATLAGAAALPADVLVLDTAEVCAELAGQPTHDPVDADRPAPLTLESPNYVVYTSGTTGRPKGVVLPARVLINLMAHLATTQPLDARDRISQFSAIGFDVSEQEMLTALLGGATLCVPDDDTCLDPDRLARWLDQQEVTVFHAPDLVIDAVYQAAREHGLRLAALREVAQAGEPLRLTRHKRDVHGARAALRLHSGYGPSETHVVTRLSLPDDVAGWPSGVPPIWAPRCATCASISSTSGCGRCRSASSASCTWPVRASRTATSTAPA